LKTPKIDFSDLKKLATSPELKEELKSIEKETVPQVRDVWLEHFLEKTKCPKCGKSLNHFDKNFKLIKRIDAHKGFYDKGQWILYDIMEQNLIPQEGNFNVSFYPQRIEKLEFRPESLSRVAKKSEEMNFKELYLYIKQVFTLTL